MGAHARLACEALRLANLCTLAGCGCGILLFHMSCALIDTWGLACLCGRLRRADELMKLGPFRKSFKEAGLTNIKKWRAKLSSLDRLFACCDVRLLVAPAVAPPLLLPHPMRLVTS